MDLSVRDTGRRRVAANVARVSTEARTDETLRLVEDAVDAMSGELTELSERLRDSPELGFAERRTGELVTRWLDRHGVACLPVAGTGLRGEIAGATPGPTVALLGELDAVHVPTHPDADPCTGAAHACGHHASLAAACGAVAAVAGVLPRLCGRLVFIGTPAEEIRPDDPAAAAGSGDDEREYPTGKAELIRHGVFDDVDVALMVHTGREAGPRFSVGDTLNGAIRVRAVFRGTAAHSGSSPWLGIDASRAARFAMDAVDAQQEAFPDDQSVRIAQRLLPEPAALGATPAEARVDVLVRARTLDTLRAALGRIDRALYAGALVVGAGLTRTTELVYAPHRSSPPLDDVVLANATAVIGSEGHARGRHLGASSDIGDLGLLMPVSHPYASGAQGQHHGPDFRVVDHVQATIEPAKYLAMTVVDLLDHDARLARDVVAADPGRMTRAEYVRLRSELASRRDAWPDLDDEPKRRPDVRS